MCEPSSAHSILSAIRRKSLMVMAILTSPWLLLIGEIAEPHRPHPLSESSGSKTLVNKKTGPAYAGPDRAIANRTEPSAYHLSPAEKERCAPSHRKRR